MKVTLPLMVAAGVGIGLLWPRAAPAPVARAAPTPIPAPPRDASPTRSVATVIPRDSSGHFVATVEVNGIALPLTIDTAADAVALTEDDARAAGVAFDPGRFEVVGRGASGPVRGQLVTIRDVVLDGRRASDVRGAVVEGLDRSLLGQSYLSTLTIEQSGGEMRLH